MANVAVRNGSLFTFAFSDCKFFYLLHQIKINCVYRLHWKSEKIRNELNELDELIYSKSLHLTTSYANWYAFLYLNAQIKTFIYLSYLKSGKWAKWARKLENIDEQLCSLTCFLESACWNMYRNVYSFMHLKS